MAQWKAFVPAAHRPSHSQSLSNVLVQLLKTPHAPPVSGEAFNWPLILILIYLLSEK
jgi:hypothetical protein